LLAKARGFFNGGDYDYAVVAAQAACEVAVDQAMSDLLARHAPDLREPIGGLVRSYSLTDKQGRKLWDALAEDNLAAQSFWDDYKSHVTLRHGVVHRGASVSGAKARESLTAADALIVHVVHLSQGSLG
jgi:hypothetical protein